MGPVLKYPGSKWSIATWINNYMPAHKVYLEPYFGSGAVLFNKPRSNIETVNDIDGNIINLFCVIREQPEELARQIEWTPWSREEYTNLLTSAGSESYFKRTGEPVEDARRMLIRMWMGHGSKTSDRTGWRHNIQSKVGACCANVWTRMTERILAAAERLKGVQIECQPAIDLINRYRYREVLIYADPPYLLETRRETRQYKHEMTDSDHIELLDVLDKHPGPVLLSGYSCRLYDERLKHWSKRTTASLAEGGRKRQETLYLNPVAAKEVLQYRLFGEEIL